MRATCEASSGSCLLQDGRSPIYFPSVFAVSSWPRNLIFLPDKPSLNSSDEGFAKREKLSILLYNSLCIVSQQESAQHEMWKCFNLRSYYDNLHCYWNSRHSMTSFQESEASWVLRFLCMKRQSLKNCSLVIDRSWQKSKIKVVRLVLLRLRIKKIDKGIPLSFSSGMFANLN